MKPMALHVGPKRRAPLTSLNHRALLTKPRPWLDNWPQGLVDKNVRIQREPSWLYI